MKHEINGLRVDVKYHQFELREAILRKIIEEDGLTCKELRRQFIEDLFNDGFLEVELGFALSKMENDELLDADFKVVKHPTDDEKGLASRSYHIHSLSTKVKK